MAIEYYTYDSSDKTVNLAFDMATEKFTLFVATGPVYLSELKSYFFGFLCIFWPVRYQMQCNQRSVFLIYYTVYFIFFLFFTQLF